MWGYCVFLTSLSLLPPQPTSRDQVLSLQHESYSNQLTLPLLERRVVLRARKPLSTNIHHYINNRLNRELQRVSRLKMPTRGTSAHRRLGPRNSVTLRVCPPAVRLLRLRDLAMDLGRASST